MGNNARTRGPPVRACDVAPKATSIGPRPWRLVYEGRRQRDERRSVSCCIYHRYTRSSGHQTKLCFLSVAPARFSVGFYLGRLPEVCAAKKPERVFTQFPIARYRQWACARCNCKHNKRAASEEAAARLLVYTQGDRTTNARCSSALL